MGVGTGAQYDVDVIGERGLSIYLSCLGRSGRRDGLGDLGTRIWGWRCGGLLSCVLRYFCMWDSVFGVRLAGVR